MLINTKPLQHIFILGFVCLFYGFIIAFSSLVLQNLATIIFLIFTTWCGYNFFKNCENTQHYLKELLIILVVIHLSLIAGVWLSSFFIDQGPILWVVDSYDIHVPGSIKIMNLLNGSSSTISRSSIYDRTYISHLFGGAFFYFFGVNQLASSLSLLVPKMITVVLIFKSVKSLSNDKNSYLACLIYILMPTILFYTTVFYKEATLQMLIAAITYLIIVLNHKMKISYFFLLVVSLVFLANERHYLFPCYVLSFILYVLTSKNVSVFAKAFIILFGLLAYLGFTHYYYDISITNLQATILKFRRLYNDYPDVSTINSSLPYPLGIVKIYFTPYFNFYKLAFFKNFATLLTWGSLFHQLFMILFSFSILKIFSTSKNKRLFFILLFPFVLFLIIFGFVAPYNGRLRDSFYPVLVIIFSIHYDDALLYVMLFKRKIADYVKLRTMIS